MLGWISLYRKMREHWIWKLREPFDKRSAWIDLLLTVNHKNQMIDFNGSNIEVERGEVLTSIEKLANRWMWSRHKVSDYLNRLENERNDSSNKGQ